MDHPPRSLGNETTSVEEEYFCRHVHGTSRGERMDETGDGVSALSLSLSLRTVLLSLPWPRPAAAVALEGIDADTWADAMN